MRPGSGADARAFRIDDDPETLGEAFAALLRHLSHRVLAGLAIDRDRRSQREAPAEERNRKQLLLRDEGEWRENKVERQGLPGRRVLRHDDVRRRAGGNVLHADDAVPDAADPADRKSTRLNSSHMSI